MRLWARRRARRPGWLWGQEAGLIRNWMWVLLLAAPAWAQSFTITTPCPLTQGTVGTNYGVQFETVNGKTPIRYAYSEGFLPPGLTFAQGGSLFGTPQAQGTLNFTIRATDDNNITVTKACSITIAPSAANPVQIATPCPLPQAASNEPYTTTLAASGGLAPYTWTLPFGALPTGYALGAVNGVISGTTTQNGSFRFILSVNDSSGQLAVKECTMATAPAGGNAFTLSSLTPNQALAGSSAVTITLRGAGFNSSSTVVWNAGTGNTVNLTTTFVDAGTLRADIPAPLLAAGGTFPIAVRRTVLTSPEFTNTLIFTVSGGLAIQTTCPLPAASQGTPYRYQLVVTGGFAPYTWTITGGALPLGLGLTSGGEVTGTATESGLSNFTLRATDSQQNAANLTCSMRVNGPYEIKPTFLSFVTTQGVSPVSQELSVTSGAGPVPVSVQAPAVPWLRTQLSNSNSPLRLRVEVDSTALAVGTYNTLLNVQAPAASNGQISIPVVVQVNAPVAAQLQVRPRGLAFRVARGVSQPQFRHLTISNSGAGTFNYAITIAPVSGGQWLTVLDTTGTVLPNQPAYAVMQANPAGLAPGTYLARVTVSDGPGGQTQTLLASMSVSAGPEQLGLSTSALTFRSAVGGAAPAAQELEVLSQGANALFWQSAGGGAAGIGNFLRVDPASESARPDLPSRVQVAADTTGLTPGLYSGLLRVSTGSDNAPRLVAAHLRLLTAGQQPGLQASPGGLLFVTQQGAGDPAAQSIALTNPAAAQASLELALNGDTRPFRLPAQTPVTLGPGETQAVQVSVASANLAAGVYEGGLVVSLAGDTQVKIVPLRLVITPSAGCARSSIHIAPVLPVAGFLAMTGSGLPVKLRLVDNCGAAVTTGAVTVRLASPDATQSSLTHTANGVWSGDVQVPGALGNGQVRLDVQATSSGNSLRAGLTVFGAADDTIAIPELVEDAVLSTSTFLPGQPVAPGGLVAAFGSNLADRAASAFPPIASLGGALAFLANPATGLSGLPMFYASPGQLNGEVPRDVLPGVSRQMVVQRGGQMSRPVDVTLAAAQPGIFTVNQQGTGQGAILDASTTAETGNAVLAGPSTPVGRGRIVSIYCEGLGRVSPEVGNGTPAPSAEPLARTVNTVTVTIGGRNATVLYAGLAPGFVGLYQVNAVVPADAPVGDAVAVTLNVANTLSNTATIAIR